MKPLRCRGCANPIAWASPAYCSETCRRRSLARRRAAAAERARRRLAMAEHPTAKEAT